MPGVLEVIRQRRRRRLKDARLVRVAAMAPVGGPAEAPAARQRRPPAGTISWNAWGKHEAP